MMKVLLESLDNKLGKKIILSLIALAVILIATALTIYSTKGYEVTVDDKCIGVVKSADIVDEIVEEILNKAEAKYHTDIFTPNKIDCKSVLFSSKISDEELKKELESSIILFSKAFAITVSNEEVAYLRSKSYAEQVLNKIMEPYVQNTSAEFNIEFLEKVSIVERDVPPSQLIGPEEALTSIIKQNDQEKKYIVKEGDTVTAIAAQFGLKIADIQKANPELDIDRISIGQEISLTVPRYTINVVTKEYKTSEEEIPFPVEYENTQDLYKGDTKVKVKGENGRKLVKEELVSINGILEETNIVEEQVLEEPKTQIVLRGTKERPRTVATGVFSMPSRGGISSRFGSRWGGTHTGIDISAPRGTPNKAADGGVVIFAGWSGNYGKLVIINHENGYTTYYAHNDTIKVKKGQRVAKGDVIGTVGSTGKTTGPHLHFEVRKNGVPVDPLKYLK